MPKIDFFLFKLKKKENYKYKDMYKKIHFIFLSDVSGVT